MEENKYEEHINKINEQAISDNKKPNKVKKEHSTAKLVLVAIVFFIIGGILVSGTFFIATSRTVKEENNEGMKIVYTNTDQDLISSIAEKVSPSVVGIRTTIQTSNIFSGQSQTGGEGSGVIMSSDGYIMTNNHVVVGALSAGSNSLSDGAKIEVILPGMKDEPYEATVIGRDEKTDIAVIKIDAVDLPVAEIGDSDNLKIGELAVAIGNPGGLDFMGTVSAGIISGLNRSLEVETGNVQTLVQTDASINPGNSGGPLTNSQGQVIGIINIKIVANGFEGLGFAIPINQAKAIADQLIQSGYIKGRPLLGISIDTTFTEDVAKQNDVPAGLLIGGVMPNSGAETAGLKANDIITKFDGQDVKTFSDVQSLKDSHQPGDVVEIVVYRYDDKSTLTFNVTLMEDTGTSSN